MKKYLLPIGVLVMALVFSGCIPQTQTQPTDINVTLTGILNRGVGENFTLKTAEGVKELHNAGATLEPYVGKSVTVTGQYSGTTLYVDKVQ